MSSTSSMPATPATQLSGLLVQAIADRVRGWVEVGKLDENDVDAALTSDARAVLDHPIAAGDWAELLDVESLVELASAQLGGETGLVEWSGEIAASWEQSASFESLIRTARGLADGPGFLVSQASALLLRQSAWSYEGGRESFSVRLSGCSEASPGLKALLGGTLARLASLVQPEAFDVRFEGVDGDELVVFGALETGAAAKADERLHRAALIP